MLLYELDYKVLKDDIYNLSLRRSALRLCKETLGNIALLENLYKSTAGSGVYNKYLSFVKQNRQISLIIQRFYRVLSAKDAPAPAHSVRKNKKNKVRSRTKKILMVLMSDILTLSSVTENGFMLNKFMLCCNALSKQLLFLYNV